MSAESKVERGRRLAEAAPLFVPTLGGSGQDLVYQLRAVIDGRRKAQRLAVRVVDDEELAGVKDELLARPDFEAILSGHSLYEPQTRTLTTSRPYSDGAIARAYMHYCRGLDAWPQSDPLSRSRAHIPRPPRYGLLKEQICGHWWNVDVSAAYFTVYATVGLAASLSRGVLVYNGVPCMRLEEWAALKAERNAVAGILMGASTTKAVRKAGGPVKYLQIQDQGSMLRNRDLARGMILAMHGVLQTLMSHPLTRPVVWTVDGGQFESAESAAAAKAAIEDLGFAAKLKEWDGWIGGPASYDGFAHRNRGLPPPLVKESFTPSDEAMSILRGLLPK